MNEPAILTALKTALQNSSDLSSVADTNIHIGEISNITTYPVIVIKPGVSTKVRDVYPFEEWRMTVSVIFALKVFDETKQIVGDVNIKGIKDFDNDVRKALSADHTLGGAALNVTIVESLPDDGSDYPVRGFVLTVEILYKQNRTTRE